MTTSEVRSLVDRRLQKLARDEVHVWSADLARHVTRLPRFSETLSLEEMARAARFRRRRDREHFVVGRGLLREILGRYAGIDPEALVFGYSRLGKPYLAGDQTLRGLKFNVAHSHGLALYAVTQFREVGVDLEYTGRDLAVGSVAEQFFSPVENAVLRNLPAAARRQAFYDCWTRKEAYLKARGMGVAPRLDAFDVAFRPGEAPSILDHREDPMEVRRWSFATLAPGPLFTGALCVEGAGWRLQCLEVAPATE